MNCIPKTSFESCFGKINPNVIPKIYIVSPESSA